MQLIVLGLFIGAILGIVATLMFGKKVETFLETEKEELQNLEAKYGTEIKNAIGTLSADAKAVIARYHYLKSKAEAFGAKL